MTHEFQCGDSVLRLCQQVHRQKPQRQWKLRRLEDRAGCDCRLVLIGLALPVLLASADEGAVRRFGTMRADQTIRSTQLRQRRVALCLLPVLIQKPGHRQLFLNLIAVHSHDSPPW